MSGVSLNLILNVNPLFDKLSQFEKQKLVNIIGKFTIPDSHLVQLKIILDTVLIVTHGEIYIEYLKEDKKIMRRLVPGDTWFGGELKECKESKIKITAADSTQVLHFRLSDLYYQVEYRRIDEILMENLGLTAEDTNHPLKHHNYLWLFNQDELEQRVISMQHFVTTVLLTLTLYVCFLEIHQKYQTSIVTSFGMISVTFFIMFIGIIKTIKKSDFPLSVVGLTLANSAVAAKEAFWGFIPLLLLTILVKYIGILFIPALHGLPIFDFRASTQELSAPVITMLLMYSFIYVPLQELLFRGGVQGFMQTLFTGSKTMVIPIVVSNVVFSTMHLIISPLMAVIIFIPGLYWGWLFARHNNLIGVCISHVLWGISAFFLLNYLDLLAIY